MYFDTDKTIGIVKLGLNEFQKSDYLKFVESSSKFYFKAKYGEEMFDVLLIQIGKSASDLEVTEDRCVDLLQKKRKNICDLLIRIPKFHTGKRMAYEPLEIINTGASEVEEFECDVDNPQEKPTSDIANVPCTSIESESGHFRNNKIKLSHDFLLPPLPTQEATPIDVQPESMDDHVTRKITNSSKALDLYM